MVRLKQLFGLALGLLSLSCPALTRLEARLDSPILTPGRSLLLSLEADASLPAEALDLRPLTHDFFIGEPKVSQRAGQTRWVLPLLPRTAGARRVPPLQLGSLHSAALMLRPGPAAAVTAAPVTLTATLSSRQAYEGEPLIYSVHIRPAPGVQLQRLSLLPAPGLDVRQLGEDELTEERRQGRRTTTLLRHYVLLPTQPGPLSLPGLLVEGESPRPFLAQAPTQQIRVLPRPAGGSAWRPARALQLEETWQPPAEIARPGEPLFRTLTVTARGMALAGLPELSLPRSPAWRSYIDDQQHREWLQQGELMVQYRLREVVLPQQGGPLTLPAQRLPWWNSALARIEQAGLPKRQLALPSPALQPPPVPHASGPGWLVAGLSVCLGAAALWLGRRPLMRRLHGSERLAWWRLRLALHRSRAPGIRMALLRWAAQRWPDQPSVGLERLPVPGLAVELEALLAACQGGPSTWRAHALRVALTRWRRQCDKAPAQLNPRGLS